MPFIKNVLPLLAIMALFHFSIAQIPSYVPTNGLVGWYPFNGNANDESNFSNHGTVSGATLTTDRFGENNKAYTFSGLNTFINTNKAPFLSPPFTISQWIYEDDIDSFSNLNAILGLGEVGGVSNLKKVHLSTQYFAQKTPSIGTSGANGIRSLSSCATKKKWIHLVVVVNSYSLNGVTFYIDNQSCGAILQDGLNYPFPTNDVGFSIGKHTAMPNSPKSFKGKIDDIGFWNRALSQQEITDLFNACSGTNIIGQPQDVSLNVQDSAVFTVTSTSGTTTQWQSNPLNIGWHNVPKNSFFYKDTINSLIVKNTSISNHNQMFRALIQKGGCLDTSAVVKIMLQDTCLETVYDTIITSVSDTLKFNINLTSVPPPSNQNLIKVYPNPTNSQIIIDNGNFSSMNNYIIKIEDAISRQVFFSKVTQQQFTVDISTMGGKGLYFLSVLDSSGKLLEVKKIVLE